MSSTLVIALIAGVVLIVAGHILTFICCPRHTVESVAKDLYDGIKSGDIKAEHWTE